METLSMDPRGARTRAALRQALDEMILETSPSHISVSELCRRARIHRTTFYKHFDSVDQFVMHVIATEIDDALNQPYSSPDSAPTLRERHLNSAISGFEKALGERDLLAKMAGPGGDGMLRRTVEERLAERFTQVAREAREAQGYPEDTEYAGRMFAAMTIAALETELLRGETDPERAATRWLGSQPHWFTDYISAG